MIEAGSGDVMVIKDNREKSILIPFEYGKFVKKVKKKNFCELGKR